jgi:hypothetical protein
MPVHQHAWPLRILVDDIERPVQFGVITAQVGREVRRLALAPRPPALVQVQGVKSEAALGEVIGKLGVEEIVGESVHHQHRMPGRSGHTASHQRRNELALPVWIRAKRKCPLPVPGKHVGLPGRGHVTHLSCASTGPDALIITPAAGRGATPDAIGITWEHRSPRSAQRTDEGCQTRRQLTGPTLCWWERAS